MILKLTQPCLFINILGLISTFVEVTMKKAGKEDFLHPHLE